MNGIKKIWESKIVWLAFLLLVVAVVEFFGVNVPDGTAESLVELDWSNLVQALLSAAVIISRIFFTSKMVEF